MPPRSKFMSSDSKLEWRRLALGCPSSAIHNRTNRSSSRGLVLFRRVYRERHSDHQDWLWRRGSVCGSCLIIHSCSNLSSIFFSSISSKHSSTSPNLLIVHLASLIKLDGLSPIQLLSPHQLRRLRIHDQRACQHIQDISKTNLRIFLLSQ